ncbi:haloacid dehalogenase type II [Candidatus Poribacteria bacterium]|nr:MAG: haloacid dehalogenase type II [Candidatus Poribacteria bacterium]
MQSTPSEVKALTFDVFGTVVDWYSSIVAEGEKFGETHGIDIDWAQFVLKWRAGYGPAMNKVRQGELPWQNIDALHRLILDALLDEFGITDLSEADKDHLNRVWHRLKPWPDAVSGLTRLRRRYIVATLSNGNVALLTNMAKFGGLPWDCILSAELTGHYKPDPEVYQTAASLLGLSPNEVMMVAAHAGDLRASQAVGFQTALVPRPLEYGPGRVQEVTAHPSDLVANDFNELADLLGIA